MLLQPGRFANCYLSTNLSIHARHPQGMARFEWPVPDDAYIRKHFVEDEIATVQYRVERCKFIWLEFGPPADMLLVGGIPAMFALDELKRSFIYGNFMATVMLAQSFVEHSLGGMYSFTGQDHVVGKGFKKLIDQACADGHVTRQLTATLHSLRTMRNPYTHHTIGTGPRTYMERLAQSGHYAPEEMVIEDARIAIRAVVDYLRHGSPHWNPDEVQWQPEKEDV